MPEFSLSIYKDSLKCLKYYIFFVYCWQKLSKQCFFLRQRTLCYIYILVKYCPSSLEREDTEDKKVYYAKAKVESPSKLFKVNLFIKYIASKSFNYWHFKNKFEFENYFKILDDKVVITFYRIRLNNHKLPVEYERWNNIPRELRICHLRNTKDFGDELHYLLKCHYINEKNQIY